MDSLKCNSDDIKTFNNNNIGMKSAYLYFNEYPLFFAYFNIHEYAIYAKMITCIVAMK